MDTEFIWTGFLPVSVTGKLLTPLQSQNLLGKFLWKTSSWGSQMFILFCFCLLVCAKRDYMLTSCVGVWFCQLLFIQLTWVTLQYFFLLQIGPDHCDSTLPVLDDIAKFRENHQWVDRCLVAVHAFCCWVCRSLFGSQLLCDSPSRLSAPRSQHVRPGGTRPPHPPGDARCLRRHEAGRSGHCALCHCSSSKSEEPHGPPWPHLSGHAP